MNYRLLFRYLGQFSIAIGALMTPAFICALCYREWSVALALFASGALSCGFGAGLCRVCQQASPKFFERETLALVGLSWIIAPALGALPFLFTGDLGPIDAYFESMSGFTTTGASVVTDIEALSHGILFWRSFTHWLGGMGIIVLFLAVLPFLGAGGKQLFRSEAPGPDPRGLRPRVRDTASILWKIYVGFTIVETVALMLAGMSLFDALCHTFGTLATGGFSSRQASVGAYNSLAIELIIIFFMICAGTNFALYFAVWHGNWRTFWKDTEWRVYIAIIGVSIFLIWTNILGAGGPEADITGKPEPIQPPHAYGSTSMALRHAAFQVVSIMTTTGYATDDFDRWPHFSRMLLIMLMFVGGCAGSTGGGMKVVRFVMMAKMVWYMLERTFRPKTIRAIRLNGEVVDPDMQRSLYGFFVLYVAVFVGSILIMSFLGLPFQTAISSVAATLNNVGPGLELVGPVRDFSQIHPVGKLIFSLLMAMGRLELLSLLVLFVPSFWRKAIHRTS